MRGANTLKPKQPNPTDAHVGSRIKLRRKLLGVSQERLGESLGVTFQQVQKYESGTNRVGASRLQMLANVLNVPISYFFEDSPGSECSSIDNVGVLSVDHMQTFMASTEGLQLNQRFLRIKDARVRRSILELLKSLGEVGA